MFNVVHIWRIRNYHTDMFMISVGVVTCGIFPDITRIRTHQQDTKKNKARYSDIMKFSTYT